MPIDKNVLQMLSVQEAVGTVLCHDITRIVPGKEKGPIFRKGHIIQKEDIPVLLSVGKEHIYIFKPQPGILHENDAAARIATAIAGNGLKRTPPKEGRINFTAAFSGLLVVDTEKLVFANSLGEIAVATLHSMQEVRQGQPVAGTRITPLLIEESKILELEKTIRSPIIEVLPFRPCSVGIVTTGSEIYHHRIEDSFGPVLHKKFAHYGCRVLGQTFTDDNADMTAEAIRAFAAQGADMIVCTGGMSVDPDDRTPSAICAACDRVVSYGAPTFPGAMFMLAWMSGSAGRIPVMGLPGCVMYHKASIFELVLPRLLAGLDVTARDIALMGHGGFCSNCPECRYPTCPFGK